MQHNVIIIRIIDIQVQIVNQKRILFFKRCRNREVPLFTVVSQIQFKVANLTGLITGDDDRNINLQRSY